MKKIKLFIYCIKVQLRRLLLLTKKEKEYYKNYLAHFEQDSFQIIDPYLDQIQNKIYKVRA